MTRPTRIPASKVCSAPTYGRHARRAGESRVDRTQLISNVRSNLAGLGRGSLGVPVLLLAMLAMMTLPIPPFLLDVLFTFNIALSIVVLLVLRVRPAAAGLRRVPDHPAGGDPVAPGAERCLDPRGAAPQATTAMAPQAGDQAFGEVVIGGNYVVRVVVFAILMIINFVVVTKGAGRISEVSARFTLDAMPGKQMAIDADLNAGLIEQEEAKKRRSEVAQEADFYGSMDGASKFVRGDAIAGLLILFINLIGGVAIGMIQHSMSFGDAGKVYALLTIGDGLVAQLPSLLLSTAAAIMVTRVSSSEDMGQQVNRQMFASPKALAISAAILIAMGAVPGMPHVSFIGLGALAGAAAYWIWHRQNKGQAGRRAGGAAPAGAAAGAARPGGQGTGLGRRHPGGHGRPGSRLPADPAGRPQPGPGNCWRGSRAYARSCPRSWAS